MTDFQTTFSTTAWIAIDHDLGADRRLSPYTLALQGDRSLYQSIAEDDWVLVLDGAGAVRRAGRVLRIRSDLETTTIFFDRVCAADVPVPAAGLSLTPPSSGSVGRISWETFVSALSKAFGHTVATVPVIEDRTYVRELLQLAVVDDLLGPAGGPHERIVDMSVRDRYLVGRLAPREAARGGIEGLEGPLAEDEVVEPTDPIVPGRYEPGAEFGTATGRVEPESDASDEIDAASNQSLVPSSFGMTFCVDGDVERIEIEARWGRYERVPNDEHEIVRKDGSKAKVWQRIPCGGKLVVPLAEGTIPHQAPDPDHPAVRIQGSVRARNAKGDRLVTLFLVNAQEEPDTNRDTAWLFQPELIVRAEPATTGRAIFRRRPVLDADGMDPERESLEMIYRKRVEFAVGHGVAVHAETAEDDPTRAIEVRTTVVPRYEVPVTETPGLDPADRPAMRRMVASGLLDMQRLAELPVAELVEALNTLTRDYGTWIAEQRSRIGRDVVGYDRQAAQALDRCEEIRARLQQGIDTLKNDEKALTAFRFANRAMALQRVRSIYALRRRRGEEPDLGELEKRERPSWRPFQLAFLLLSIPSLADPMHADRVQPMEAHADLLWFPTGGGKTEAYLGVAAFTMAIRRLQGKLGGYDGSRGLAVIMRYTLRLLTLQQFQRATALICAMEMLRREALADGDTSLGHEPFTIGLWVGNRVTPGTTEDSHRAIEDIRNPGRHQAGATSPVQLTSCPWCGSDIAPGRDVDVDKDRGRTLVFCGDKKGRCEFSRGKSSKSPHPGIPVLTVDEEIYHRPPTMMIATVDKFALMAWRGEVRTLFGRVSQECERHGLLWPGCACHTGHRASKGLPAATVRSVSPIRPPDLIIQDEFHLISGPLGTMVGLYESAVDELCGWTLDGKTIKPKIVASTATVRKAKEQVNNVFMRRVSVFPPHGLDVEDDYFSVQRPIDRQPGRRYLGVCSPGSSRPAVLIRVYTAFLTAAQALFERFGEVADPYMTMVGYFNSLRELGGMRRLAEDDVQTRSYRVRMSMVERPALAQRSVSNIRELTSRVSSQDIPKYLDDLEVKFKATFDPNTGKFVTRWNHSDTRAIDVVLATNMMSVGVDVNRLGLMVVNGQPKGTAEYIQATSRVGRSYPGLVCTVLTWARPRDLSHYETFEHYHATFYKHVEAQSVTPFSPRAMDRGLSGALLSLMRLEYADFSPNEGAAALDRPDKPEILEAIEVLKRRAWNVSENRDIAELAERELKKRADEWAKEANVPGRTLAYEKRGERAATTVGLIKSPGIHAWDDWTVPMSMREVEPGVRLIMNTGRLSDGHGWKPRPVSSEED